MNDEQDEKKETLKETNQADQVVWTRKDIFWYGLTAVSCVIGLVIILQGFYSSRENDRINHRLDVGDAYFYKALIDRSKLLEQGYYAERRQNEKTREHCKSNPCNLPPELNVSLAEIKITPLDSILTDKTKDKQND